LTVLIILSHLERQ